MLITVCFIIILKHTESKYIFRGVSFIKQNISKGYISVLTDRFSLIRKTSVGGLTGCDLLYKEKEIEDIIQNFSRPT